MNGTFIYHGDARASKIMIIYTCNSSTWELRQFFGQFCLDIFDILILIAVSGSMYTATLEAFPPGGPALKCLFYMKLHLLSGTKIHRLIRKCYIFL